MKRRCHTVRTARIIKDKSLKDHASPRYMRSFDFHKGEEKNKALESLLDL